MSDFMSTIKLLIQCGSFLFLAFLILLAMPQSQLRAFLMPIVGWGLAIICGIYCLNPLDLAPEAFLGPFGLVDDAVALATGIAAGYSAYNAQHHYDSAA